MAGLCEGDNELPVFLKAICVVTDLMLHTLNLLQFIEFSVLFSDDVPNMRDSDVRLAGDSYISVVGSTIRIFSSDRQQSLKCAMGTRCRPVCTVVQQGEIAYPLAATRLKWCTAFSAGNRS
ncbi:hypothetical protein ANN_06506 [Periplaneta americana]|uniref:Uncharacterized protein n=1 Tax=Periplaneta americana TaxID=6978 RepID=A0ABQ8TFG5_PERAM|nr:hypothetical protein ANN_06506 [Periplaneta americana]